MIAGIIISAAVYWFASVHMDYSIKNDYKLIRKGFLAFQYVCILLWETTKAVVGVMRIVFRPKINVDSRIMYFRTDLKTNRALVVLANSVTLMPGSVVVALDKGQFCIHCLDVGLVADIEKSAPVRHLLKCEE
jgi:multisubunit Na+/H+ antiporter MnhE subunit